jgi:hypothetical protein
VFARRLLTMLVSVSLGCGASAARVPAEQPRDVRAPLTDAPPVHEKPLEPSVLEQAPHVPPRTEQAKPALDLHSVAPLQLAAPPFARTLVAPTRPLPTEPAPKPVQLRAVAADPVRALDPAPYRADAPYFLAPVEDGALPAGARADIPTHYAGEGLRAIIPSAEHLLLVYGGRYLAVTRGDAVLQVFDLEGFRHPPRAAPQWQDFAVQDATYAQIAGDTLYVCNGGGSYARDVDGKKGFVSAIELATGALRWRSDPLVCNSTFAIYGEHMITGYGFTAEPDFMFVLRLADGKTLRKTRLATGPDSITLDGNRLRVETYDHSYDFELR